MDEDDSVLEQYRRGGDDDDDNDNDNDTVEPMNFHGGNSDRNNTISHSNTNNTLFGLTGRSAGGGGGGGGDATTTAGSGGGISVGREDGISPLEQEVLSEYERLLGNMDKLSSTLSTLAGGPITLEIADNLRLLERKVTSVYTLMKASVYSIVLQQGQMDDDDDDNNNVENGMGTGGGGGGDGDSRFG